MVSSSQKLPVIWSKGAILSLRKAYEHIREDSLSNAEKVREGILQIADSLSENQEKFPLDKFKNNNPGNYRAFEKYSFRVAYKHTEKEVRILRVRHIKQEPKKY